MLCDAGGIASVVFQVFGMKIFLMWGCVALLLFSPSLFWGYFVICSFLFQLL